MEILWLVTPQRLCRGPGIDVQFADHDRSVEIRPSRVQRPHETLDASLDRLSGD